METKSIFKPNQKNVAVGLLLFLLIGFVAWVPVVSSIMKAGFGVLSMMTISYFDLIIALIAGYLLSCILTGYFDMTNLKNQSWSIKLILIYLLLQLFSVLSTILGGLKPSFGENFLARALHSFGWIPTIYVALLVVSLVFLLIKHKNSYLFGTSFFLMKLLNPMTTIGLLFFGPNAQGEPISGTLLSAFQSLLNGDDRGILISLIGSLFFILVVIYLVFAHLKYHKKEDKASFEKIMLIAIIATYLISRYATRFFF
jgi:hypothetical protein